MHENGQWQNESFALLGLSAATLSVSERHSFRDGRDLHPLVHSPSGHSSSGWPCQNQELHLGFPLGAGALRGSRIGPANQDWKALVWNAGVIGCSFNPLMPQCLSLVLLFCFLIVLWALSLEKSDSNFIGICSAGWWQKYSRHGKIWIWLGSRKFVGFFLFQFFSLLIFFWVSFIHVRN